MMMYLKSEVICGFSWTNPLIPYKLGCSRQRFSRVSSRPRNGRGMGQNSSPRLVLDLEKQGSKVSSLKWLRKRLKFRGIPRLVLEKAEEKGKIPRLASSSTSGKSYQRSRTRPRQMTPREPQQNTAG